MRLCSLCFISFASVSLAAQYAGPRISQIKCQEYAKKLQQVATPNKPEVLEEYASAKQLPFTALLGYGKGVVTYWLCGATMISPSYLISAVHCAQHHRIGAARLAWLGDLELGTMEDDARTNIVDIEEIHVHPKYTDTPREHDIALFKLQTDFEPSLYIRPACLSLSETHRQLIAPGWGANADAFLNTMRLKVGKVMMDEICPRNYSSHDWLSQGVLNESLCVSTLSPTSNMCQSDSGGGLLTEYIVDKVNMWSLIAVNSMNGDCLTGPSLFVNISSHMDWIESIVWKS